MKQTKIPDKYKKIIIKTAKNEGVKNTLKGGLSLIDKLKTTNDPKNVDEQIYHPVYNYYSYLYYISLKIVAESDSKYEDYANLSFEEFKKIQNQIEPNIILVTTFSSIVVVATNTLSFALIALIKKLLSKPTFKNIAINLVSIVIYVLLKYVKNSPDLEREDVEFNDIKNLIEETFKDEDLATTFFMLYFVPYIEETFKNYCNKDTKLGLKTILISNIINESVNHFLSKYIYDVNKILDSINKRKKAYDNYFNNVEKDGSDTKYIYLEYKLSEAIVRYSIPTNNLKHKLYKLLLLLITSLISKYGNKVLKSSIVLSINIVIHFVFNSMIFNIYFEELYVSWKKVEKHKKEENERFKKDKK